MRVISGSARGKKLAAREGMDTRPTTDRVKEAIFNIIQFQVPGARVLDLFGGSGALAVEALSRGAQSAVVVDESKEAIRIIQQNLRETRLAEKAKVLQMDDQSFLKGYHGEPFDLVFLDPPYGKDMVNRAMKTLIGCQCVAPCGIIICESEKGDLLLEQVGQFRQKKQYRYGKTVLTVYRAEDPEVDS